MQGKALQYATWRRTCTNPKGRVFISGVYSSRRPGQDRQPRRVHRILPDSGLVRGPQSWQPGSSAHAHAPSTHGFGRATWPPLVLLCAAKRPLRRAESPPFPVARARVREALPVRNRAHKLMDFASRRRKVKLGSKPHLLWGTAFGTFVTFILFVRHYAHMSVAKGEGASNACILPYLSHVFCARMV